MGHTANSKLSLLLFLVLVLPSGSYAKSLSNPLKKKVGNHYRFKKNGQVKLRSSFKLIRHLVNPAPELSARKEYFQWEEPKTHQRYYDQFIYQAGDPYQFIRYRHHSSIVSAYGFDQKSEVIDWLMQCGAYQNQLTCFTVNTRYCRALESIRFNLPSHGKNLKYKISEYQQALKAGKVIEQERSFIKENLTDFWLLIQDSKLTQRQQQEKVLVLSLTKKLNSFSLEAPLSQMSRKSNLEETQEEEILREVQPFKNQCEALEVLQESD